MQLTVLPFLSTFVFSYVTASIDIDKQSGFDCGRVFFGRNVIRNAGSLVSRNMKRSSQISLVDGDLFHERDSNHIGWPIRESGQIHGLSRSRENFYILVDFSGKVKDVMARLSNDDFTRCLRKNSRRKSLSLITSNGYRCGQNFFGDDQLRGDVDEAISKLGQGLKYPIPYKGNLYPGHQYLTWPILNEKKDNTSHWEQSAFHVIFSRDGKIIDVVAKLKCNDFIKCERATKSLRGRSAERSQLLKRQNPTPVPLDYTCDQHTFKHDYLVVCVNQALAKEPSSKEKPLYPMKYTESPCSKQDPCRIWPVFAGGRIYSKGKNPGIYFLVIGLSSNIRAVVKIQNGNVAHCVASRGQTLPQRPNADGPTGLTRNARGELVALRGSRPPTRPFQPHR